jgi:hypothetical protein
MAKITYETDNGRSFTFQIADVLITDIQSYHDIDVWKEILEIMRIEIEALNNLEEATDGNEGI